MGNTVRLDLLPPIQGGKLLSQVQDGRMPVTEYLEQLRKAQGVHAGWDPAGAIWTIDFGKGILDPSGQPLDIEEVLEVVKALMPSPLRSAGKTIVLRGPMPAAAAALVCRVCYAARVVIEVLDRTTGMVRSIPIDKLERDRVRLVRPDTAETLRDIGNGWVEATTTQLTYRRRQNGPRFGYAQPVDLVFLETANPQRPGVRCQVYDGRYYAWVNNPAHLEDVL